MPTGCRRACDCRNFEEDSAVTGWQVVWCASEEASGICGWSQTARLLLGSALRIVGIFMTKLKWGVRLALSPLPRRRKWLEAASSSLRLARSAASGSQARNSPGPPGLGLAGCTDCATSRTRARRSPCSGHCSPTSVGTPSLAAAIAARRPATAPSSSHPHLRRRRRRRRHRPPCSHAAPRECPSALRACGQPHTCTHVERADARTPLKHRNPRARTHSAVSARGTAARAHAHSQAGRCSSDKEL